MISQNPQLLRSVSRAPTAACDTRALRCAFDVPPGRRPDSHKSLASRLNQIASSCRPQACTPFPRPKQSVPSSRSTIQFKHSRWMEARSHGPQQAGHCRVIDVFEGMWPWRRAQSSVLDAAAPMREEDGLDAALSRVRSDLPGVVVMDAVPGVSPAPLRLRVTIPELGPDQPLQVLADRHGRSIVVTRGPRRQGGIERALAWMQFLHEAKLPARHWIRNSWSAIVGVAGLSLTLRDDGCRHVAAATSIPQGRRVPHRQSTPRASSGTVRAAGRRMTRCHGRQPLTVRRPVSTGSPAGQRLRRICSRSARAAVLQTGRWPRATGASGCRALFHHLTESTAARQMAVRLKSEPASALRQDWRSRLGSGRHTPG